MTVVVVDPYSSGRFLVQELALQEVPMIAVRSPLALGQQDPHLLATYDPKPFQLVIDHQNLEATCAELGDVRAVIAGAESGVSLADEIAERLQVPARNGLELSSARRNKYEMQETLRQAGVRSIAQKLCKTRDDVLEFVEKTLPCVLKPTESAGTQGVYKCLDVPGACTAFDAIVSSTNVFSVDNEVALAQEFLVGDEYIIDCVSYEGTHVVVGLWKYHKVEAGGGFAYDYTEALEFSAEPGSVPRTLFEYTFKCLDALGIRYGPSHSEAILVNGTEPCLVETGARMQGSCGPNLWERCAGRERSPHFLTVDAMLRGGEALRAWAAEGSPPAYQLQKHCIQLDVQCHVEGKLLRSIEDVAGEYVKSLASYAMHAFEWRAGDDAVITRDMLTSPGYVILIHESKEQVDKDKDTLRVAQKGWYKVAAPEILSPPRVRIRSRANSAAVEEFAGQFGSPRSIACSSPTLSPVELPRIRALSGLEDECTFVLDGLSETPSESQRSS